MLRLTSAVTLLLVLLISTAHPQRNRDWVLLGEQTVGFGVDRDVINISQSEDWFRDRSFRSLRFVAERNDVHMMSIRLVYMNGYTEDFRIDRLIRQGGQLPIDLGGDRSYLRRIEMVYRSRPDFRGQAVIKVFGEPARRVRPAGNDWVLLGEQTVGFGVDRDVINISQSEDWFRDRSFRSLRFVAERNDVHMMSIRLVYMNGYTEDFRIDRLIRQGEQLPIDLGGDRSYLRRIEMVYRSRPDFRGQAVIKVFGEPARRFGGPPGPPPPPGRDGDWAELGCQQVSLFDQDRDSIRIGRRDGRFTAIRLYVRDGDVEVLDLTVIYSDGKADDIPVKRFIRAGERTSPLDLGWERSVDRVDLVYRTVLNPIDIIVQQRVRVATVCVEGLQ
jgi:hypothetical protein